MKPVLLLLPGMLNDARVWSDVAHHLGDAAEVRCADVGARTASARCVMTRGPCWQMFLRTAMC